MSDFHFDFAVLLSVLTVLTGIGWALDKWRFAPRRAPGAKPAWLLDFSRSFFPVILAVLMLRSFLFEPFRIPSGSMLPTLLVGDFILVNKFAYGLRDPVFHTKFFARGEPQRGDVVVFRWPVDTSKDFIKRVIGLPGDHLEYRDKILKVNGVEISLDPAGAYTPQGVPLATIEQFREDLTGVRHDILINPSRPAEDFEFTVPEGQYFMMGDNRDGSDDSRRWGTVPERNLVGRAFMIWMSWNGDRMRPDLGRIGQGIR